MTKTIDIDCLFIGHNEMNFIDYEKTIREMGINSGAYRDLNLNFLLYNNRPYTAPEIFNIFHYQNDAADKSQKPFHVAESFSAAISYLGSYLDRKGYTFDYVNSFQASRAELAEKLAKENILTIAITTTLYVSPFPIIEIIDFIKTYNRTARIILGGPFVSTKVRTLARQELEFLFINSIGADFYINSSQGESALVEIIAALKQDLPVDEINNVYCKIGNTLKAGNTSRENNLLAENTVNWDLFAGKVGKYVNVRTAISCPFSCSFCGFPLHAGKYQVAPVELIEEELVKLDKIGTVTSVYFIDDTFNIPVERFKEILRMMIKNNFGFKWHSYFRCQFADPEMVELMKLSGCEGVFLGLESGNDQILKNMNKAVDVQKYREGILLLKKNGIVTFGDFIIGFPGETEETVRETVRFIEQSGLDFFRTQLWYCEPITPIYKEKDRYNIKGTSFEWSHATMNSQKACDLIQQIFLTVKEPIWIPQYNFDFFSLWHLVHRGMTIEQVHAFLKSFNAAVREKITTPSRGEIGYDALMRLKSTCSNPHQDEDQRAEDMDEEKNITIDQSEGDFEFL